MIDTDGFTFYTLKEARQRLNVSDPTIRGYIKRGKIKAVTMFGRLYISDQHLREYMERATDTATNTAAAIRATDTEREPGTTRVYAVGVNEKDVTADGITADQLQLIPMDVTADEWATMQERNLYVYTMELYAAQILDAIRRDGFNPERVPVFDTMDDHARDNDK